ncbi:MAG: hypothetical protein Alis3KO_34000 [Aliiglaciecola sp.]
MENVMKPLIILYSLLAIVPNASANIIKLEYAGYVERMFFADCTNLVNGNCNQWDNTDINTSDFFAGNVVNDNDMANGSFLYNTNLDYSLSSDGFQAIYRDGVSDYALQLGSTFLPNSTLIRSPFGDSLSIVNNRGSGSFLFDSFFAQTLFSQGDWFASSYVSLSNRFGTLFDGFDIPNTLSFDDLTSASFRIGFLYRPTGDQLQISGSITELSFSPAFKVSEPPTVMLYLVMLALLYRFSAVSKFVIFLNQINLREAAKTYRIKTV